MTWLLSPTPITPRTGEIKHNIPSQTLLVALRQYMCHRPALHIYLCHDPCMHLQGCGQLLGWFPHTRGLTAPCCMCQVFVIKHPPSIQHSISLLSKHWQCRRQGQRRIRDTSINSKTRWCLVPLSCLVPSWGGPQSTAKNPKGSGSWCAGISHLCNIFSCCAVNHRQSSGCPSPTAQLLIQGPAILIRARNSQPAEVGCFFFVRK